RKRTADRRPGVPHRTRPVHVPTHPVHVTLRSTSAVRCLRSARAFPAVRRALAVASHAGFRILHFSVQDDHLHLIVEADDRRALGRGLRGVTIRVARASTAPSAGEGASGATGITPGRSPRRARCATAWFTCCSIAGNT